MQKQIFMLLAVMMSGLTYLACQAPTTEADLRAINRLREQEWTWLKAGQVDSLLAIAGDEMVFLPPNEPAVTGKEAIRSWIQGFLDQFTVEATSSAEEIVVAGDWAFERYSFAWTLTPLAGGDPIQDSGKGVHIYQRQTDGSWKFALDIWNSNNPPPGTH